MAWFSSFVIGLSLSFTISEFLPYQIFISWVFFEENWSCSVWSQQGPGAELCSLRKKADMLACAVSHLASLVLFYRFPHIFLEWPLATYGAWVDPLWEAGGITWFSRENLPVPYGVWMVSVHVPVSHGLFHSVSSKVYVRAFAFISTVWCGLYDIERLRPQHVPISSLPSVAAVAPGPEHVTVRLISWWLRPQLLPLYPYPHSTIGGSRVHARALKCCSALRCSGLQHHPVFSCNSLFSLVLMTPPGPGSSAELHNHTLLLVGHPGGNKVKTVLKVSCSARSPSLLCARTPFFSCIFCPN